MQNAPLKNGAKSAAIGLSEMQHWGFAIFALGLQKLCSEVPIETIIYQIRC
jgi:hypothetical protein